MKSNEIAAIKGIALGDGQEDLTIATICSVVDAFAANLPYTIDPLNAHFVPVNVLNVIPEDRENYWDFKHGDPKSLFDALKAWSDTRKTAYSLQLCFLLQALLVYKDLKIPLLENNELLSVWGLSPEDGDKLRESLKSLMSDRDRILNATTKEEREEALLAAYKSIQTNFGAWRPREDVEMFCYFAHIDYPRYSTLAHKPSYAISAGYLGIDSGDTPKGLK